MAYVQGTLKYGFSPEDHYTHRVLFWNGDSTDRTGGSGTINMSGLTVPSSRAPIVYLQHYMENYLVLLQELAQPGVQVLECFGEQFAAGDWATRVVQYSASWDVTNFTPLVTNLAAGGPRGRDFMAARQRIPATNRNGWLRWHYIARNYLQLKTTLLPSEITAKFDDWYPNLRNLGSPIGSYAAVTGALAILPVVTSKELPATTLRQGIRNG